MSSFIQVHNGGVFDPLNPNPDLIFLEDIAHALAQQVRYNGHCDVPYSVGEHSVRASRLAKDPYVAKWILLHDAPEVYIGDLASPLKVDPDFGQKFRVVEKRIMRAVCARFDLDWHEPPEVHEADLTMLATEVRDLMPEKTPEAVEIWAQWIDGIVPLEKRIEPWGWKRAKGEFLSRYARLERQLRREAA